jgi:oligosaccharide repeat unit polymerase
MGANSNVIRSAPKPRMAASTLIILLGLGVTYSILPSADAAKIFTTAAIGVGLSLGLGTVAEAQSNVRTLIRVDILMLWVLYSLTFLEFLFPQWGVNELVSPDAAVSGTAAAFLGFSGIAIGRHLIPRRSEQDTPVVHVRPRDIFVLFIMVTLLGYLHILLAVNFDVLEALRQMSWPRFTQSWTRGRYGGDIFSLIVELGALIYVIPPIAGIIYARNKQYGATQRLFVTLILALTIYYGISLGTRSVVAAYVFTFFGTYYLSKDHLRWSQVLLQGAVTTILLLAITAYMLAYRNVGWSNLSFSNTETLDTLYIDHNMVVISGLTEAFPNLYDYLGLEIPYQSLIHPIPRALWPGKPEGLSVSIESIMQNTQGTVASTFVGEAYMSGGMIGVLLASLAFGMAAEFWNRLGRDVYSPFSQLLYVSGFLCAVVTMRSMLWTTVAMLPTLALWTYGRLFLQPARSDTRRRVEMAGKSPSPRPPPNVREIDREKRSS